MAAQERTITAEDEIWSAGIQEDNRFRGGGSRVRQGMKWNVVVWWARGVVLAHVCTTLLEYIHRVHQSVRCLCVYMKLIFVILWKNVDFCLQALVCVCTLLDLYVSEDHFDSVWRFYEWGCGRPNRQNKCRHWTFLQTRDYVETSRFKFSILCCDNAMVRLDLDTQTCHSKHGWKLSRRLLE